MARSLDEPFTLYGLVASGMDTDDARSFATFHIDPRARFSDGTPITAEDVALHLRPVEGEGRPQQRQAFGAVKGVETPDPRRPLRPRRARRSRVAALPGLMPVLLAMPIRRRPFRRDQSHASDRQRPLSRRDRSKAGKRLVLERNPDYWGRDLPSRRGMFNFDRVDIEYYRDGNSLFEAFKAGLCDFRIETDPTRWLTGYDFPATAGWPRRQGSRAGPACPRAWKASPSTRDAPLRRCARARGAGRHVRFRLDQPQPLRRPLSAHAELLRRQRTGVDGRPRTPPRRALLAPFPGAVRADMRDGSWRPPVGDGSGRDRTVARRALALLAGRATRSTAARS